MLQNYYHFYNMVRIQVEEEGNDVVNCYEVAVAERNKCVRENQVAKDKVDRVLRATKNTWMHSELHTNLLLTPHRLSRSWRTWPRSFPISRRASPIWRAIPTVWRNKSPTHNRSSPNPSSSPSNCSNPYKCCKTCWSTTIKCALWKSIMFWA